MYDDTFIAPLPRSQLLSEIEMVADFIAKKVIAAKKAYTSATDPREKMDILLCLITYQSIISLLNAAYLTEDYNMLNSAKETYRNFPDFQHQTSNFDTHNIMVFIDRLTDATQTSLSLDVAVLSHLTDNQHFIKIADRIS